MEFVLYWLTTLEHFDVPRESPFEISDFSIYRVASITNYFLVRNGALHPVPPLTGGPLSHLNLYRSCVCCYSLCEFICASFLLCLEDTVYSELSITFVY